MHPFLNTFIEQNFQEKLNYFEKNNVISDEYDNWTSPAIVIPNLDLKILEDIKNLSEKFSNNLVRNSGFKFTDNWYSYYSSDSWKELLLLDNDKSNEIYDFTSGKAINTKENNEVFEQESILELCLNLLNIDNLDGIKNLKINTVDPGGFIHPHKDKMSNVRCLWVPLHNFSWCLKFFPFGWLMHETGNAYLINNGMYVHGVLNDSKERRYILSMDFFEDLSRSKLSKWHTESPYNWKDIFTNNF